MKLILFIFSIYSVRLHVWYGIIWISSRLIHILTLSYFPQTFQCYIYVIIFAVSASTLKEHILIIKKKATQIKFDTIFNYSLKEFSLTVLHLSCNFNEHQTTKSDIVYKVLISLSSVLALRNAKHEIRQFVIYIISDGYS